MAKEGQQRHFNYEVLGPEMLFPIPGNETLFDSTRLFNPAEVRKLSREKDGDYLKFRLIRREILNILQVDNLADVPAIFNNEKKKAVIRHRLLEMYRRLYGLTEQSDRDIWRMIVAALKLADGVIDIFENPEVGILKQYRTSMEMTNEVRAIEDPVDLLLLMFSPKATAVAQYEARRKLVLADTAFHAQLFLEEAVKPMDSFLRTTQRLMFGGVIGATKHLEILSAHSPTDYSAQEVNILQTGEKVGISPYNRYTNFVMREWDYGSGKRLAAVESRTKDPRSLILKMLRKETKDPYQTDDYLGAKLVFLSKADIFRFLDTFSQKAAQDGILLDFMEVADSIENGMDFRALNNGASPSLEVVKAHVRVNGQMAELQMYTIRTFLDSRYHDDFGHETAYSFKRLFESGVVELLYPESIYGINFSNGEVLQAIRQQRRSATREEALISLPKERRLSVEMTP